MTALPHSYRSDPLLGGVGGNGDFLAGVPVCAGTRVRVGQTDMTALPHSYRSDPLLVCGACQESYRADIWLIVDVAERPDLAARICDGTIQAGVCPTCGESQLVDMGLLVFRPSGNPVLLFSPAQETTPEEDQDQARGLLNLLYQTMREAWQDKWLNGFGPLPREALVEMLMADTDKRE